ncbi:MacS family sensor histidine kinase [Solicola sp. PLA-1-18]|uniref:MacS family sensor histidine kinase n=1 Tax=Solicola sp. PLA-1-18 TaxID=3380532 RepID=UPI003B7DE1EC
MVADQARAAAEHVDTQFFRALTVLRAVTLAFALAINAARWQQLERPALAASLLGAMVVWTAVVTWLYDRPGRRRSWVFVADVAVAIVLLRCTVLVESEAMMVQHDSTITSYWVCTAVLACAVRWGPVGGLVASVLVSVADVTIRPEITSSTVGNVFLLVLAGVLVGYCGQAVRQAAVARTVAERRAAVAEERERLARAVHDGVLQVLAMVQRRGAEIGGETAELAGLAGEQEVALRSLIQSSVDEASAGEQSPLADLAAGLNALSSPRTTVATPSTPVLLDRHVVGELVAVVSACRDNVSSHVGDDAPMWVLLESEADGVVVSVRDEGPGIAPGRLEQAEREGRLGVSSSIRGRVEDLGGSIDLVTAPGQGTEWEIRLTTSAAARVRP